MRERRNGDRADVRHLRHGGASRPRAGREGRPADGPYLGSPRPRRRRHRAARAGGDRLGEKPLYYAMTPAGLLFASEPKAILASGFVDRTVDANAIGGFLRTGYVAAPRSAFGAIAALVPGTRLVVEGESARVAPFW